jgi:alpha-1,3-glucosyltransferase
MPPHTTPESAHFATRPCEREPTILEPADEGYLRRAAAFAQEHWRLYAAAAAFKALFAAGYRSTDFEVHRNWLAVTHSTPISRWYEESTSQWTLDYPPAFAYAEWGLSQAAALVSPDLVMLSSTPIEGPAVVAFQRASVLAADVLLLGGTALYAAAASSGRPGPYWRTVAALVLLDPGLLLVDHVHFQYNGALIGILFAVMALLRADRPLAAAAAFTAAVLTRHTLLYLAPLIGTWLLARYVWPAGTWGRRMGRVAALAACSAAAAAILLAPVLWADPLRAGSAMLSRLFPFSRGLLHGYWAPNVWAPYATLDAVLRVVTRSSSPWSATALAVLPTPAPAVCALLALAAQAPLLVAVAAGRVPPCRLPEAIASAWLCASAFGWHVHEKAGLYALLPLALAVGEGGAGAARLFWRASLPLHFALTPLIFTPLEQPAVVVLLAGHAALTWEGLGGGEWTLTAAERAYAAALAATHAFALTHAMVLPRLPFLHLMAVSDASFVGVAGATVAATAAAVCGYMGTKGRGEELAGGKSRPARDTPTARQLPAGADPG